MMEKPAMMRQTIITLLSLGVCVSFYTGLVYGLTPIISHRYFQYGMYRLSAAILQEQLNKWFIISLVTVGVFILICSVIVLLFKLISWFLNVRYSGVRDSTMRAMIRDKLTVVLVCIVCFSSLISTGWVMADMLPVGILNSGGSVLLIVLLVWSCMRGKRKTLTCLVHLKALIVLGVLLCLNSGMLVANTRAATQGPNIILLVIDCLRPDHLGYHGYPKETSPAIDRLAGNGMVYTNAYSNAPWTKPSVATLFTSLYPHVHGIIDSSQVLPNTALTIAELLRNDGYRTFFINGGNPYIEKRFNFNQGFDYYHYLHHKTKSAADVTHSLLSQLATKKHEKFFAYVHYMDAHAPYNKNEYNDLFREKPDEQVFLNRKIPKGNVIRKMTANDELTDHHKRDIIALYDGQIRYIDKNIQGIITFLREEHLLENTVVIVTSDHGEEFWEHNNFEHGHSLYNELIRVPLIISGGTIESSNITARVSLIDLLPTVLDIVGISGDSFTLQGVSLLKTVQQSDNNRAVPVFATGTLYGNEKYCLIRGNKKMIVTTDAGDNKRGLIGYQNKNRRELYNVRYDAHEQENLIAAQEEDMIAMEKDLESFVHMASVFQQEGEKPTIVIDGDLQDRLNSLGYLE
jgi:arylsulfatase A-like enzyme